MYTVVDITKFDAHDSYTINTKTKIPIYMNTWICEQDPNQKVVKSNKRQSLQDDKKVV